MWSVKLVTLNLMLNNNNKRAGIYNKSIFNAMLELNNKTILITGGTGSLGKALTRTILEKWPRVSRLIIFSRD